MKVDFFIVGAPKAGTTSLYNYLNEHPFIYMSKIKEPNYFSHDLISDQGMYYTNVKIGSEQKYHSLFSNDSHKTFGEASVSYLFYKEVPTRIHKYNKNAKIIIVLRDPVERAFSHYLMDLRLGLVKCDFSDIIFNDCNCKNKELYFQQYVKVSKYYLQVKRYLDLFGKENVQIIDYEDLKKNRLGVLKKIFLFLGVDSNFKADLTKEYNKHMSSENNFYQFLYSLSLFHKGMKFLLPKKNKTGSI